MLRADEVYLKSSWGLRLFIFLMACFYFTDARAASIDVYGIPLKVDAIEFMPDQMLRIAIFGEERIITKSQSAAFAIETYVEHRSFSSLSPNDEQTIIRKALEAGDLRSATGALLLLLSHPDMEEGQLDAFFDLIKDIPGFQQLLRNVILSGLSSEDLLRADLTAPLLFYAALYDRDWVRQNGVRLAYRFFDNTKGYIRERFVRSFAKSKGVDTDKILKIMEAFFGANDRDLRNFHAIFQRVQSVRKAFSDNNLTEVLAVMGHYGAETSSDPLMSSIVTEIIYEECTRLISEAAFSEVLLLLSRVDFNQRSPKAHELVLQALKGLNAEHAAVLSGKDVQQMIHSYAEKDEALKQAYIEILLARARSLLDEKKLFEVDGVLNNLLNERPDPNPENDKLRIAQTKAFLKLGMETAAVKKLTEVKTRISLSDRLWFGCYSLFYKTSIWVYIALLFFLGLLSIAVHLVSLRRKKIRKKKWRDLGWEGYADSQAKDMSHTFVMHELRTKLDPVLQEYYSCLQVFALNPGASTGEIKNAYRTKMKVIHPDLNVGEEEESSKEFIRIRKAYERLLQMEKEGVPTPFR